MHRQTARTMRLAITAFAGLACAALLAPAPVKAEMPSKITIGTEGAYPPFNYVDKDGTVKGFEIDLAKAMCKQMKVECSFFVQDWDGIIPGLLAKKYDAIIASLYITDERRKKIDFSQKYYQVPARFVVPKSSDIQITAEGLAGKVVGTQRATSFERFMRDKLPEVELRVYATFDEVYLDLAAGRIDAAMGDVVALSDGFLKTPAGADFEFRGPKFTGAKWFGYGAGVGLRKGETELLQAFNTAIDTIRADGTYDRISEQWFGFDVYGE